jgi:hypothetical protein
MNVHIIENAHKRNSNIREIANENLSSLMLRWSAAHVSVDVAMETFDLPRDLLTKLALLSREQVVTLSDVGFSLLLLDKEQLFDIARMIGKLQSVTVKNEYVTAAMTDALIKENRSGLIRRWHSAQLSVTETMQRFGLDQKSVEAIANFSYDELDSLASAGIPLFKLACDEKIIELTGIAESSKELARMSMLRGY